MKVSVCVTHMHHNGAPESLSTPSQATCLHGPLNLRLPHKMNRHALLLRPRSQWRLNTFVIYR